LQQGHLRAGGTRRQTLGLFLPRTRVRRAPAQWAGVSEDELLAEGRLVAEEDWQGQIAERGRSSKLLLELVELTGIEPVTS
jgi:hypothetical protein